jgi:hypothetical protein
VPQIHEWPDEDEVEQWQKEAEKLWAEEAKKAEEDK